MSRLVKFAMVAAMMVLPAIAMGGDTEIAQSIVKSLQDKKATGSLKGFNIGLRVEEGVVWLEGHVSSDTQHDMAIDVARRASGVKRVVDAIEVAQGNQVAAQPAKPIQSSKPVDQPRELMAADLTRPQVAGQHLATEAPGDFSFNPVKPASAEKSVVESNSNQGLRPLRPVPTQAHRAATGQAPMAMAPAGHPAYQVAANNRAHMAQQPMAVAQAPGYYPNAAYGYAQPVRYDQPHMPRYAWPGYAAHPNYAAVSYPRQYSPMAWPYIGPFYPYPQVPLGWRKVTMEYEKGWWTLDFKARRFNSF